MGEPRWIPGNPSLDGLLSSMASRNPEADATRLYKQVITGTENLEAAFLNFKREPSAKNANAFQSTLTDLNKQMTVYKANLAMVQNPQKYMDNIKNQRP